MTGIYSIFNIVNNKWYIGSTVKSFDFRKTQHFSDLRLNRHKNVHLQRSFNKYGENSFIFIILETINSHDCLKVEQLYLDLFKPEYNINPNATSGAGRKLTKEQLKNHYFSNNKKLTSWNKGIPFSEEVRKKMSLARIGVTPAIKGLKLKKYKPIQRDDGKIYHCIYDAAMDLNVKENTIIKACTDKNKLRRVKGYILKYI